MNNILEVNNLGKIYNEFQLKDINFSLPYGFIMGLIGENGAGKTTTIKAILNMISKDSGDIAIFGKNNIKDEIEIKKNIGAVFDSNYFVDSWKIKDVEKSMRLFYDNWDNIKSHNHHFKWWFGLALIRADYMRAQKGGYHKRCHWSAYKAVLLESSFLDSSACSLIYFFIASSVILPIVET